MSGRPPLPVSREVRPAAALLPDDAVAVDLPAVAESEVPEEPLPGLYCLLTIIIAAVAGTTFFKINGMYPFPWHYVPFVAVCAVAVECGISSRRPGSRLRLGKIVLACCVAAVSLQAAWSTAHLRRTKWTAWPRSWKRQRKRRSDPGGTFLVASEFPEVLSRIRHLADGAGLRQRSEKRLARPRDFDQELMTAESNPAHAGPGKKDLARRRESVDCGAFPSYPR